MTNLMYEESGEMHMVTDENVVILLIGILFCTTFLFLVLYFDMCWQFRRYKDFIYKELLKDVDMHTVPTEPVVDRHEPLSKPIRKRVRHAKYIS